MSQAGADPIVTSRLRLLACEPAMIEAAMRGALSLASGVVVHPQWPGDDLAGMLPLALTTLLRDPSSLPFGVWVAVLDGVVVGDVGGHGPPRDGDIEIGFSVVPAMRRQGIASEIVPAFVERIRALDGVRRILARVDSGNEASLRVLARSGLERLEEQDGILLLAG